MDVQPLLLVIDFCDLCGTRLPEGGAEHEWGNGLESGQFGIDYGTWVPHLQENAPP